MRLREHRRNLEVGHLERSTLAQRSLEENPLVLWEKAKILETEKNPVYSKYEGHLESKERFAIQRYLLIIGKKKNMQVL